MKLFRWARLIRKVHETDPLVCPKCQGLMRVIAFITDEEVIYQILDHLDTFEPDPPPRSPPPHGQAAFHPAPSQE